jgi:hypothetical protein
MARKRKAHNKKTRKGGRVTTKQIGTLREMAEYHNERADYYNTESIYCLGRYRKVRMKAAEKHRRWADLLLELAKEGA